MLVGGARADTLAGGINADILGGGGDADALFGGNGADSLNGGAGTDTLWGNAGNDTLLGGLGDDLMHGGIGHDVFVFTSGADTIEDFRQQNEELRLSSDLLPDGALPSVDDLTALAEVTNSGWLRLVFDDDNSLVLIGLTSVDQIHDSVVFI